MYVSNSGELLNGIKSGCDKHESGIHNVEASGRFDTLVNGLGVQGDAHNGLTMKHRSRIAKDPTQPNLRQVYLIHSELFDESRSKGFDVRPGIMGENVSTVDIDLLLLPKGTLLKIGADVVVEITGLRNRCAQLDGLISGLMKTGWVSRGRKWAVDDCKPDVVIESVGELVGIIPT